MAAFIIIFIFLQLLSTTMCGSFRNERSLASSGSFLELSISEVSIQKSKVQPFDPSNGCPLNNDAPHSSWPANYYAVVKFAIYNSGQTDFTPSLDALAYVGEADCQKPAIFNFLVLDGLIPGVKLSKYATCVVEDDSAGTCSSSSTTAMKIGKSQYYGRTRDVSIQFAIQQSDFQALLDISATTDLTLQLSVNPLISDGSLAQVTVLALKRAQLSEFDWFGSFPPPVVLYSNHDVNANSVVITDLKNNYAGIYINLAEVQLFNNGIQVSSQQLTFTFSEAYLTLYADLCNNGILTDICLSDGPNPTLTIRSTEAFDTVVVYNRGDGVAYDRIEGATIIATVNGKTSSTVFPQSAVSKYTFVIQQPSGQLHIWYTPSAIPTLAPTSAHSVVIADLIAHPEGKYINLAEVQLFNDDIQIPPQHLTFTFSEAYLTLYADLCNNGILTDICLSDGPNPTLTIGSSEVFDKVVVYNRVDGGGFERINGATITAKVNGKTSSTVFPLSASIKYTFAIQQPSATLEYTGSG